MKIYAFLLGLFLLLKIFMKQVDTLAPKGEEPGYIGSFHDITNELSVPGLKIAPKSTILSRISELGNPYALLLKGRDFTRRNRYFR